MTYSANSPRKKKVDCNNCRARIDGLCTGASSDTLLDIARSRMGDREIKAGQDLFAFGEPNETIYNLVSGWVFRYQLLEDGRRQILDFALPGAVLGFHPIARSSTTFGAQTLTDCVVCAIPYSALGPLSREHPELGLRLAWLMSRDRSLAYDHLTNIGRRSARKRVAHLLLELFVRYRAQWPGFRIEEMHLPLTQEHIGDATGLTSVHVNRVLRDLRRDGVVEFHYRHLQILDPDKLVNEAEMDPQLALSWLRQGSPKAEAGRRQDAPIAPPRCSDVAEGRRRAYA